MLFLLFDYNVSYLESFQNPFNNFIQRLDTKLLSTSNSIKSIPIEILNRKNSEMFLSTENTLSKKVSNLKVTHKPEVLSPAGGWPQLKAAVANGADAVYFGLEEGFNARARYFY